jgi:hypothetical protein
VRKTYFGRAEAARLASDALEDAGRARRAVHEEQSQWAPVEELLNGLDAACVLLLAATLGAAGYHRHDRGKWRRRHAVEEE